MKAYLHMSNLLGYALLQYSIKCPDILAFKALTSCQFSAGGPSKQVNQATSGGQDVRLQLKNVDEHVSRYPIKKN